MRKPSCAAHNCGLRCPAGALASFLLAVGRGALSAHCRGGNNGEVQEAGSDGTALACTPGASVRCVGANACSGYQVCDANGSALGPCLCGEPAPPAAGGVNVTDMKGISRDWRMGGPASVRAPTFRHIAAASLAGALLVWGCSQSGSAVQTSDAGDDAAALADSPVTADGQDAGDSAAGDTPDTSMDAPSDVSDATVSDASASDASTEGSSPATILCAPCPAGTKSCWTGCVPTNDPWTACGVGGTCTPCQVANATPACSDAGACTIGACNAGFADCNMNASDGCEAALDTAQNCGSCGTTCPSGLCSNGKCVASCPPPTTNCSGACVDLTSDPTHCGNCGTSCANIYDTNSIETCSGGKCSTSATCEFPLTYCPTVGCFDTNDDPGHCGSSCTQCPGGAFATCSGGVCGIECPPGWTQCGSDCVATWISVLDCGSCGNACPVGDWCDQGACTPMPTIASGVAPTAMATDGVSISYLSNSTLYGSNLHTDFVYSVRLGGDGGVVVLSPSEANPVSVTMDSQYTYWASMDGGAIRRARSDGSGAPASIATAVSPTGVIVDPTNAYFVDRNGLSEVPVAGGAATVIDTNGAWFDPLFFASSDVVAGDVMNENPWIDFIPPGTEHVYEAVHPNDVWLGASGKYVLASDGWSWLSWFDLEHPCYANSCILQGQVLPSGQGYAVYAAAEPPIVALSCGVYLQSAGVLWWAPLRKYMSNTGLPTVVPVVIAPANYQLTLASHDSTVYVGTSPLTVDAGVAASGAIYAVGMP